MTQLLGLPLILSQYRVGALAGDAKPFLDKWVLADVGGLFSFNVGPFSRNLGQNAPIFWGIWWLDGRDPTSNLDPTMKGHFLKGVGTFYADDTLRGKPIRVRFIWSHITAASAHWEQAFSADAGKTWETNWVTDFTKAD
jgi:hypothetical protein